MLIEGVALQVSMINHMDKAKFICILVLHFSNLLTPDPKNKLIQEKPSTSLNYIFELG